jgi:hypothetical protein
MATLLRSGTAMPEDSPKKTPAGLADPNLQQRSPHPSAGYTCVAHAAAAPLAQLSWLHARDPALGQPSSHSDAYPARGSCARAAKSLSYLRLQVVANTLSSTLKHYTLHLDTNVRQRMAPRQKRPPRTFHRPSAAAFRSGTARLELINGSYTPVSRARVAVLAPPWRLRAGSLTWRSSSHATKPTQLAYRARRRRLRCREDLH